MIADHPYHSPPRGCRKGCQKGAALPPEDIPPGVPVSTEGVPVLARRARQSERRCIVSGAVLPKRRLLRFVAAPGGTVVPDVEGKLPGRGLWLSARRDVVEMATRKKIFSRAARRGLAAAPDLADQVAALLRRRCLDTLGFARRGGLVTAGFDKVRAESKAGRVVMLLEAAEGATDGRRRVSALTPRAPVVDIFTGAELAAILGRDHVVHVALLCGPPAQRILARRLAFEIDRLKTYLGDLPPANGKDRNGHLRALAQGRTGPVKWVLADAGVQGPSEHTDSDA